MEGDNQMEPERLQAMSVAFAVFTSDPNLLPCELARLDAEVALPDGQSANAVGVGAYAQDEVLLQRHPGSPTLKSLSKVWPRLDSEALLYHARTLPVGVSPEESTQPFRFHSWLFCHDGAVSEFARVRPSLVAALPEFLQRHIRSDMDSELVFACFLKHLRDTGRTDDPSLDPALAAQLLGKTVRFVEQRAHDSGAAKNSELNCIATNGRMMIATRYGSGMLAYSLLEGSPRCERCGLDGTMSDSLPIVRAHRRRRTVALISHARPPNWIEVPQGTAIAIGRDLSIQRMPI